MSVHLVCTLCRKKDWFYFYLCIYLYALSLLIQFCFCCHLYSIINQPSFSLKDHNSLILMCIIYRLVCVINLSPSSPLFRLVNRCQFINIIRIHIIHDCRQNTLKPVPEIAFTTDFTDFGSLHKSCSSQWQNDWDFVQSDVCDVQLSMLSLFIYCTVYVTFAVFNSFIVSFTFYVLLTFSSL